jgi:hypothetical protein
MALESGARADSWLGTWPSRAGSARNARGVITSSCRTTLRAKAGRRRSLPVKCRAAGVGPGASASAKRRAPESERRNDLRGQKGEPCSAASRPFGPLHPAGGCGGLDRLRSVLRSRCRRRGGGTLPSDRRGRVTPSVTSRMCYQRNAMPRLDRQYLIPDSSTSLLASSSRTALSRRRVSLRALS